MRLFLHIDEVDDNDSAAIANSQLVSDLANRLEIGFQNRVFEIAFPYVSTRVDVDHDERFRLIELLTALPETPLRAAEAARLAYLLLADLGV